MNLAPSTIRLLSALAEKPRTRAQLELGGVVPRSRNFPFLQALRAGLITREPGMRKPYHLTDAGRAVAARLATGNIGGVVPPYTAARLAIAQAKRIGRPVAILRDREGFVTLVDLEAGIHDRRDEWQATVSPTSKVRDIVEQIKEGW